MADFCSCDTLNQDINCDRFRECVSIDVYRIYDSCADRDCLENQRVLFSTEYQQIIDQASSVRVRDVSVFDVDINLEPLPFRRGFYSIDITFFFEVNLEAYVLPNNVAMPVLGLCISNKKVILYGGEGSVKLFTSDLDQTTPSSQLRNLPRCTVQVADPVILSVKLCNICECKEDCSFYKIPEAILTRFGGDFVREDANKVVFISLGVFSIVQIERNVQVLIPTYNFSIPKKDCTSSDEPCELFDKIDFPIDEFFPPISSSESANERDFNTNNFSRSANSGCRCGREN